MRKLVVTLAILLAAPAAADDQLQALLKQMVPEQAPTGSVDVTGWLEKSASGTELVVTLTPQGAAKLVADPGLTVTPLPGTDATAPGDPVEVVEQQTSYLSSPPTVRVPLPRHTAGPVAARVDYAYCLKDYQCLFGEATVRAGDASETCSQTTASC